MRMLSYAQNGEDVLLDRTFADRATPGFYVDIGANDPVFHSVTKHFYDRGWSGVNVEPQPALHGRLTQGRPRDRNLNVGISDRDGSLTFFEAPTLDGWSTFSADQARRVRELGHEVIERPVPVTTLASLLDSVADRTIDFLKIDVEDHERQVIAGGDWERHRPRVMLVETNGWEDWEPTLLAACYHFATFDGLNRYYVRDEDRDLLGRLAVPVNVFDESMPFGYHRLIEDLRARTEELDALSRPSRAVVRRWCRLERRIGRLVGQIARTVRQAG